MEFMREKIEEIQEGHKQQFLSSTLYRSVSWNIFDYFLWHLRRARLIYLGNFWIIFFYQKKTIKNFLNMPFAGWECYNKVRTLSSKNIHYSNENAENAKKASHEILIAYFLLLLSDALPLLVSLEESLWYAFQFRVMDDV